MGRDGYAWRDGREPSRFLYLFGVALGVGVLAVVLFELMRWEAGKLPHFIGRTFNAVDKLQICLLETLMALSLRTYPRFVSRDSCCA
jgi:hypothetical protein